MKKSPFFACLLAGLSCGLIGSVHAAPAPAPTPATVSPLPTIAPPAAATVAWYAVEVLVFRRTAPLAGGSETWPAAVPEPSLAHAVYPQAAATAAYSALAHSAPALASAERRLESAGIYEVVAGLGWRQPEDSSLPVSFALIPASAPPGATAPAVFPAPVPINPVAIRLDGTARLLIAGTRAYLALNLRLCEPAPPDIVVQAPNKETARAGLAATLAAPFEAQTPDFPIPSSGEQCFALNQNREATPGRLEYFDNPLFGALALVRPITPPANPTAAPSTTHEPARPPDPD